MYVTKWALASLSSEIVYACGYWSLLVVRSNPARVYYALEALVILFCLLQRRVSKPSLSHVRPLGVNLPLGVSLPLGVMIFHPEK
jgi:hypothetical protein